MKLINKISNYFLISTTITYVIFAIMLYMIVQNTITNEVDEQLTNVYQKIVKGLITGQEVGFPPFVEISEFTNTKFESGYKNVTLKTDGEDENEGEPFRQYSSVTMVNGKQFIVTVRISLIEKEDMFFSTFFLTIGAVFLFLIILFLINKFSSQKVLKDFYNTLEKLENFSLANNDKLELNKSKIKEFTRLNEVVENLSEKAKSEYRSLKEFTEESNHELQTPVAVVKSKLEMLLQSEDIKEEELSLINVAINNLNKLDRINKSILLLNKLEHKELFDNCEMKLSEEIKNVISSYSDFIEAKNLSVDFTYREEISIHINQSLINILVSNLLSNAIKHNFDNGLIRIELAKNTLLIVNSGLQSKGDTEKFFRRFYKEPKSADSVGLGLTIVKKICDLYKFKIRIEFRDELFYTNLDFNNTEISK